MTALFLIASAFFSFAVGTWVLWSEREQIGQWWESRTARPNPREYPRRYVVNEWEEQDDVAQFGDTVMWFRATGLFVMGIICLLLGLSLLF